MEDPDAPDPAAPKRVSFHWVLYDIPADIGNLPSGIGGRDLPESCREGLNDWKKLSFGGPSPPMGRHRYFFRLYPLDQVLGDLKHPSKAKLERAMDGHVLSAAERMGTHQKSR